MKSILFVMSAAVTSRAHALATGSSNSAADESLRFCPSGTSPLLLWAADAGFCRLGGGGWQEDQYHHQQQQVAMVLQDEDEAAQEPKLLPRAAVLSSPGGVTTTTNNNNNNNNNETGWVGPRHCVREYCVYWNRQFAGEGLVVITDDKNAKRISQLPDHRGSSSTTNTTTTRIEEPEQPPAFYATEVPGKGIGLVANRTIRRGERIMLWQPTYMIHRKLTEALSPEEQQYILDAALMRLPAPRRRAFSRQLGQFGGHRVSDILLTNSFQMDVAAGEEDHEVQQGAQGHHLGNFPDVSRFNHDCRPNVAFRIDAWLAHHTHAARDIAAGEELTLAYMNPFETHAVRQEHIRSSWGFRCACAHCTMAAEQIAESDARLWEIDRLEAELGDVASTKVTPRLVRRLLELYELERLDVKMHGAYVLAALNYNLFGDAKNAKKYAELAIEAGIVEFGPEVEDVKAMRELVKNPRAHFTWRKRIGG